MTNGQAVAVAVGLIFVGALGCFVLEIVIRATGARRGIVDDR